MTRHLKRDDNVVLNRPFSVFIEPGDVNEEGNVEWFAKIVGFELDHIVYSTSPQEAMVEAIELLNMLSGRCSATHPDHNFIVKTSLGEHDAWECARCGAVVAESELEDE